MGTFSQFKDSRKFVALEAAEEKSPIWVKQPQLPTAFYNAIILKKIGDSIGKIPKIDACTSATLRGRYASQCVEVPFNKPVKLHIKIGNYRQHIKYEGKDQLCHGCRKIENHKDVVHQYLLRKLRTKVNYNLAINGRW